MRKGARRRHQLPDGKPPNRPAAQGRLTFLTLRSAFGPQKGRRAAAQRRVAKGLRAMLKIVKTNGNRVKINSFLSPRGAKNLAANGFLATFAKKPQATRCLSVRHKGSPTRAEPAHQASGFCRETPTGPIGPTGGPKPALRGATPTSKSKPRPTRPANGAPLPAGPRGKKRKE